jgi:hypothetical protein
MKPESITKFRTVIESGTKTLSAAIVGEKTASSDDFASLAKNLEAQRKLADAAQRWQNASREVLTILEGMIPPPPPVPLTAEQKVLEKVQALTGQTSDHGDGLRVGDVWKSKIPKRLVLQGQSIPVQTWRDVYIAVLKFMYSSYRLRMHDWVEQRNQPGMKPFWSENQATYSRSRSIGDVFVETDKEHNAMSRVLFDIMQYLQIPINDVIIYE